MEFNTVFQLLSLKLQRPALLERADALLFMPDLLSYFLTGKKVCEYSIATTSQLIDVHTGAWSEEVLSALGLPAHILQPPVPTGTVIGKLSPAVCEELGVPPADVIAVAGHDTQSAVTAVPTTEKDFAFISCGTWSLFGTEPEAPIVDDVSAALNFTNTYKAAGEVEFAGEKKLTGKALQEGQFEFELYHYDPETGDKVGDPIEVVSNDAEGIAHFSALTFDQNDVSDDPDEEEELLEELTDETQLLAAGYGGLL